MDKKNDHKQDEYDFYREVMKKKPLDKRKIAVSAAGVAAGAVLFGVIAASVFASRCLISDRRKNSESEYRGGSIDGRGRRKYSSAGDTGRRKRRCADR